MTDYNQLFQPVKDLFSQNAVQTVFMAWLPTTLAPYLTKNMSVDMFLISASATILTALFLSFSGICCSLYSGSIPWLQNTITVQVEYYETGIYGDQSISTLYEALSWLISNQTQKLRKGLFIAQPKAREWDEIVEDDCKPPDFNMLPERNQDVNVEYKNRKFKVTRAYLEDKKKKKTRGRYERADGYWYRIQALSASRGLETVALDENHEKLLYKELNTFVTDKDFYARIGMPYRRGILLYGKPGTGKTSLINAISAHLNRDLYFINLKNVKLDNELSSAFSGVPPNQIIVLEDVDTMSKVIHKRARNSTSVISDSEIGPLPEDSSSKAGDKTSGTTGPSYSSTFSLSTFLSCLDGHILSEGNIIIMTTNHVEQLDPAVIRPGRMDVRLNLGYCTHYQINKMYRSVLEDKTAEFPKETLDKIPELILPPCEVMMKMVLYRSEPELIPEKVLELVDIYRDKEYIPLEDLITETEETEGKKDENFDNEKKEKDENFDNEKKEKKENSDNEKKENEISKENKEAAKKTDTKTDIKIDHKLKKFVITTVTTTTIDANNSDSIYEEKDTDSDTSTIIDSTETTKESLVDGKKSKIQI
ncbi:7421_t:CDS:2 [Ambispora leptoticha]|uniref:7421_t:CDS:1 n=1 Tax=Ambispora leptoticha TaxID=144679 RepID=A0A9N9DKS9_9GLOM|nr:7421_t:CDS:2 [Ambispora leptoticha]